MRNTLLALIGLLLLGGGYYLYTNTAPPEAPEEDTVVDEANNETEETTDTTGEHMEDGSMEEGAMDENAATSSVQTFTITGENFSFSEQQIRVHKGDTVRINFESVEGFHDWVIDEFDAATDQVRPGTLTSVEFVADEAGTFEYYCSVGNHREQGMVGQLIVEE